MADLLTRPRRIRQWAAKDKPLPKGAVSVARGRWATPWAPVIIPGWCTGARDAAVQDYIDWLVYPDMNYRGLYVNKRLMGFRGKAESVAARDALMAALPSLSGKTLACYCHEGQPCHGDVLLFLANGGHLMSENGLRATWSWLYANFPTAAAARRAPGADTTQDGNRG